MFKLSSHLFKILLLRLKGYQKWDVPKGGHQQAHESNALVFVGVAQSQQTYISSPFSVLVLVKGLRKKMVITYKQYEMGVAYFLSHFLVDYLYICLFRIVIQHLFFISFSKTKFIWL